MSSNGKALSKSEILGASDVTVEALDVPEWGGRVYLRTMSGSDYDAFSELAAASPGGVGLRADIVSRCLCDENGQPQQWSAEEVVALGERAGHVLDRVAAAALRISGISKDAIEETKKN